MKTYFAKYLPVEGEIQSSCIVLETLTTGERELFQVDTKNDIDLTRQQLVKLFLCSKDIQVGDKVTNNQNAIIHWNKEMEDLFLKGSLLKEGLFKIIGEISIGATWVKEGDEFDESEVKRNLICHDDSFGSGDSYCFHCRCSTRCLSEDYNYLIKGPCGHFH